MKRLFAIFGGLVCLLLVVLAGFGIWLATFDANENKDWIAGKFREATGRDLTLGGNIDISFYPWLGVTAETVSVGNAPDFSATPLLAANHLEFRIKLLPLLSSRYEIDTVKLDGVRVNLEVLGSGQNNWSALAGAPAATATVPAVEPSPGDSAWLNNLVLGGVSITDTSLVYDDQFANTHYEINQLNASIGALEYGAPLDIRMTLQAASRTPELAADMAVNGTVLYDRDQGRYDLNPLALTATLSGPGVPAGAAELKLGTALSMDLDEDTLTLNDVVLDALGTHLVAQVEAARVQTATPAVNATLEVNGTDLAVLFRVLEQNELAARISSVDSSFSVTGSVEADLRSGTLNIPALQARLLNADIRSELQVSAFNTDTPVLSGNLSAAGPDLPTLIEVVGMVQGGSSSALSQTGRDLAQMPEKGFRVQTRFSANMQDATVAVPEFALNLFGSTINGKVDASNIKDSKALQATGELNAQGPDLPLLLQIAGQLLGGRESALYQYGDKLRLGVRERAFTVNTGFSADLARGNIELPALTADLLGFNVNAKLNARDMQGSNGIVSGSLALTGDNLNEVLTALDQPQLGEVAQSMELTVEVAGSSSNLRVSPLRMNVVLSGRQIPDSPQTLAFAAEAVMNLDNKSLQADTFSLSGLGLDLSGNASATNLDSAPSYSGALNIPAFNARRFLQQLNIPLPPMTDDTVLGKVALNSAFGGTASSFNLNNMTLVVDESTVTGSFAVSDIATLATNFVVNVDKLNADRYMAPATTEPESTSAEASPLPVEELRALSVQGTLNVDELTINRLNMRDIEMQLNAAGGDLALYPFKASLYEGSFDGDIRLNTKGETPSASVTTTLTKVNLEPLLQDFMDSTLVTGIGNIQLSLTGSGADTAAIKRNLNGNGSLQLEDGVLSGVDVAAVLTSIETMIRNRKAQALPQGGSTPFEESAATLSILDGVISTNDLVVQAPGWKLSGNGMLVDLASDQINFNLLVDVDESTVTSADTEYNLGGYSLPIECTGAINSPRCLPDAKQILAATLGSAVQQRLGEFLQERLGGGQQQTPAATPDSTTEAQQLQPEQQTTPAPETAPEAAPEEEDLEDQLIKGALDRLLR